MAFINDPIADMFVRIKNANQRKYKHVYVPYSKKKEVIIKIFKKEGFILGYKILGEGIEKKIIVGLKYKNNKKALVNIKKISKPSLKVYASCQELPRVFSGFGIAIISTSLGMMTDREARGKNIGGEVIAYVW